MEMSETEKVINDLNTAKLALCNPQMLTTEMCIRIGQAVTSAIALLKEQGTKTGKWIEQEGCDGDVYYDCSVCGESWVTIEGTPQENGMLYCPHCGAKMEGR